VSACAGQVLRGRCGDEESTVRSTALAALSAAFVLIALVLLALGVGQIASVNQAVGLRGTEAQSF